MFYEFYPQIKDKYFDEVKDLSVPAREAQLFLRTCEEMPIAIHDDDVIAGWYGLDDSIEAPEKYLLADKECDTGREFAYEDAITPAEYSAKRIWEDFYCVETSFGTGHTCINYERVIREGLNSYINEVKAELAGMDTADTRDYAGELSEDLAGKLPAKKELLEAMLVSLYAVGIYAGRFADLAESKARTATDVKNAERLNRMAAALRKVPMKPADSFYEAVSAVWIMHTLIPVSDKSWASISLGRMDQYLYPFYLKSLAEGVTREECKACMMNLFKLLDSYGDGACALNIGGMDADGNDQMNELSELIIEVEKELCLRAPILVARVHPGMPEEILDSLIDEELFQIGQPTFYGEVPCRKAVAGRGIEENEAAGFAVNSCMGLVIAGDEIADMWGCLFNMHLPLELALNAGRPIFGMLPMEVETDLQEQPENMEQLWDAYREYLRELLAVGLDYNRRQSINCAVNSPNPLLSALTGNCIRQGVDRAVGARFNNVTVEAMGMINTGNAIYAIEELVFRQNKYTINEMLEAVRDDYYGHSDILNDIRRCSRYGKAEKEVDAVCAKLGDILADLCEEFNFANVRYIPSLHTLDANVRYGQKLYSTLDGRLVGEPVNKNAGPTNDVRSADPTGVVISAAALNQFRFSGGQPIDVYFDKTLFATKERRDKIKALVKTYFELGGLQFQVNSVDPVMLRKAYENPEQYRQIVVRIGGYSVRFVDLSRASQKEFIERFEKESA